MCLPRLGDERELNFHRSLCKTLLKIEKKKRKKRKRKSNISMLFGKTEIRKSAKIELKLAVYKERKMGGERVLCKSQVRSHPHLCNAASTAACEAISRNCQVINNKL